MPHGVCAHCKTEDVWLVGRGLCGTCHKKKDIRFQYKLKNGRTEEDTAGDHLPEPTQEELDAMIAERMKNLPAWWRHDTSE